MADFEEAIQWVLNHEGGFVDHPYDPGGATNFGISLRFLRESDRGLRYDYDSDGDLDAADVENLTEADAKMIYRVNFWPPYMEQITCQNVATKLLDMSVNMGERQAVKLLQRGFSVLDDGLFGPMTLTCVNAQRAQMLDNVCSEQARFYYGLVERQRQREAFLFGWLRRAYALPENH